MRAIEISGSRRRFMTGAGFALLAADLLPLLGCSAGRASTDAKAAAGNLIIRSGQGFVPHTHDLWIPYAILSAPPAQGVTLTSTMARGHTHEVFLSHDQLAQVNRGGAVSVRGGSHRFVIARSLAVGNLHASAQMHGDEA